MTSELEINELEQQRADHQKEMQTLKGKIAKINSHICKARVQQLKESGLLSKVRWAFTDRLLFPLAFTSVPEMSLQEEISAVLGFSGERKTPLSNGVELNVTRQLVLQVTDTETFPAFIKEWGLSFSSEPLTL